MMMRIQATLQLISLLQLLGTTLAETEIWPQSVVVPEEAYYDYIVVGAGSAGCIIANRLAEDDQVNVILIEAGGDPTEESVLTGLFPKLVRSTYDWSYRAEHDPRMGQFTVNKSIELTTGRLLGGSTSLNHVLHVRGHPKDYDSWADIINDPSWNYKNMLPYLQKSEKLVDQKILESNGKMYGKNGYVTLTKYPESINEKYLKAFEEVGHKTVDDVNKETVLGYTEPIMYISEDGMRQSTAESYLTGKENKTNLHVIKNTEVIKILFDDNKNAIGVIARNKTKDFKICSNKEVIVTAGTFNSPKLLMLSGIGPKESLEKHGITVISDLPVGKNLQDHTLVLLVHKLAPSNATNEPRDPHLFPLSCFIGFGAVNQSQDFPDYLSINLVVNNDPSTMQQLSVALFNFIDDISETFARASDGYEMLLSVVSQVYPQSRGTVELKSNDPSDPPLITLNALSHKQDATDIARFIQNFLEVQKSEYFKSVNAELIMPDVGCNQEDVLERFECYAKAAGSTSWHYVGTCSAGSVVDSNLIVKGTKRLRVADASVIVKIPSAKMNAPTMAVAEKAADLIKRSHS